MESPIKKTQQEVREAMIRFSGQFEDQIKILRLMGRDETELLALTKGAMAMKDAAGIYLAWSSHYVEQINKSEELDMDEASEGVLGGNDG
ncbi:MAG: hypothetical protein AAB035_04860 [Nitrospirota bacterium]